MYLSVAGSLLVGLGFFRRQHGVTPKSLRGMQAFYVILECHKTEKVKQSARQCRRADAVWGHD